MEDTSQQFQMGVDNMLKMITEIDQTACGVMEEIGNAEILLLRGRKAWRKRRKGLYMDERLDRDLSVPVLGCSEFSHTPEPPKPKQVEETEGLSFVHFASYDSVNDLKW
ncbi:hypothetical protein NC651_038218 [Populus alba x Populus x berolinensis]|nr:hypothetical protein NC651_038218 [Populus alba x Populus x berolinensis]